MREITIKKYVKYSFGIAFAVFILNKFYLRPWVVTHELPALFQVIVFSVPNFIESILGTLILTGIILQLRLSLGKKKKLKETTVYLLAVGVASLYVISQELKLHNIGGNNVYDPFDVIASVVGLLLTYIALKKFGFIA
jgi:hypothetical protein